MKRLLIAFLTMFVVSTAFALPVDHKDTRFLLDNESANHQKVALGTQLIRNKVQLMRARYDYAVLGGASAGTMILRDYDNKPAVLPVGAMVKQVTIKGITSVTSVVGQAPTAVLTLVNSGDLLGSSAVSVFVAAAKVAGVPTGSAANMIAPLAAAASPKVTLAGTGAWTGGKFDVLIEYFLTD